MDNDYSTTLSDPFQHHSSEGVDKTNLEVIGQAKRSTTDLSYDYNNLNQDNDNMLYTLREQRIQQLKKKKEAILKLKSSEKNSYNEITEKDFINLISQTKPAVCHIFSAEFPRCSIMDKHLCKVASEHPETFFVRLSAHLAPFIISKFKIRILPTLLYFKGGSLIHTSVGFSDFGGSDHFLTSELLKLLYRFKIINNLGSDFIDDSQSESDLDEL